MIGTPLHGSRKCASRSDGPTSLEQRRQARAVARRALEHMLGVAHVAHDLDVALALIGGQAVAAQHVEQPAAGLLEQRPREAVDVHRAALARREAVEGRVQRAMAEGAEQLARYYVLRCDRRLTS